MRTCMGILPLPCISLPAGGMPLSGSWTHVLHLRHGTDLELFESPTYGDTPPFSEICQVEAMVTSCWRQKC